MSKCPRHSSQQLHQQQQETSPLLPSQAAYPRTSSLSTSQETMTVEKPGFFNPPSSKPTNAFMIANDSNGHIHLIIGSNSIASARCVRSLQAGAKPILVIKAVGSEGLHYGIQRRVDTGEVEWIQRDFEEEDLRLLGRVEVDGYVDAVFVTLPIENELCKSVIPQLVIAS